MSWLLGRSKEPENRSPEITHGQKHKHKQIVWLREQVPGVVEVKRDEHYRVIIVVQGRQLTLDIILPSRFPMASPVVQVSPPVHHPWVNNQMVVDGSPLIKNFVVHSNLGRAIQQVIRELTDHPPEFLSSVPPMAMPQPTLPPGPIQPPVGGFTPYSYNSAPQVIGSTAGPAPSGPEVRARRPAPPPPSEHARSYSVPPIPDCSSDIEAMSKEQLQKFLGEEEGTILVQKYVSQLDAIKKVQVDRDELFEENESQASINLNHEPELEEGWEQLQRKFFELETLKEAHEKLLSEQSHLTQRYDTKKVISLLKTLAQDAETESEAIAEEFLDSKMSVTEFIQKHQEQRKLHHLRKSKYEKLLHTPS